jgi:hypothetical protein
MNHHTIPHSCLLCGGLWRARTGHAGPMPTTTAPALNGDTYVYVVFTIVAGHHGSGSG